MAILTQNQFRELAGVQGGSCISIFLPTHSGGREVLNHEDRLNFKNNLKDIGVELEKRGLAAAEIAKRLEPLHQLLEDPDLWRNLAKGLAVFSSEKFLRYFTLPLAFTPGYFIEHGFYLKPLLPYFMGDGNFHLLTLNFHEVQLYRGNREHLEEITFDPPLPQRLEEVVGFDYEEKFLGYHASKMGGHSKAIFHGHGEWQEDEKDEILAFFRAVDKEIAPVLHGGETPLVIAALDYLAAIYQDANTYPFRYPEPLTGNPKHVPLPDLHKKVWDMLAFHFDGERQKQANLLLQLHDTGRTSTDIRDVIPAALGGRVEALFLDKNEEKWGVYDSSDASVRIDEKQHLSDTSLYNLAAVHTFLNGGKVYLESREALPLPDSPVNALYRY